MARLGTSLLLLIASSSLGCHLCQHPYDYMGPVANCECACMPCYERAGSILGDMGEDVYTGQIMTQTETKKETISEDADSEQTRPEPGPEDGYYEQKPETKVRPGPSARGKRHPMSIRRQR